MYSPCCPPVITNPCTTVNTVPCPGGDPCSTQLISCEQVIYSGPNLPCTQIKNCDTLCVALQKIDEQICDLNSEILILQQVLNNCCNTTSTTTTAPPSTTTTSTSRTSTTTSTSSSTSTTSSTSSTTSTSTSSTSTTTSTTTVPPTTSTTTSTSSSTSTTTSTSSTSSTTSTTSSTSSTSSTTSTSTSSTSSTTTTSTSSSTTTSTTTAVPPSCFCYTVENTSEVTANFSYTACGGGPIDDTLGAGLSTNVCSSTYPTGDDGIIITGGTLPCTNDEDCTGTTTTTTSSSSTTTSSTTVPPDCNCYSIENLSTIQPFTPIGIDCNGVELPPVPVELTIYVCSYTTPGVPPGAPLVVTLIGNCSACPTTTTTTTVCTCVDSITFTTSGAGTITYQDCLGNTYNLEAPEAGTYTITDTVNCINRFSIGGFVLSSIVSYGPCCTPPPTTTTTSTSSTSSTTTSTTTCISPCLDTEYSVTGSGTAEWFGCNAPGLPPNTQFVETGTYFFCHDGSGVIFYGGATGTPTGNESICGCNEPIPTTTTTSTSSSTTTTSTTLSPG